MAGASIRASWWWQRRVAICHTFDQSDQWSTYIHISWNFFYLGRSNKKKFFLVRKNFKKFDQKNLFVFFWPFFGSPFFKFDTDLSKFLLFRDSGKFRGNNVLSGGPNWTFCLTFVIYNFRLFTKNKFSMHFTFFNYLLFCQLLSLNYFIIQINHYSNFWLILNFLFLFYAFLANHQSEWTPKIRRISKPRSGF